MLIRRDILKQLGGLDERLSMMEHLDLCLSVNEISGSIYFEPKSVVTYTPFEESRTTFHDFCFYLLWWSPEWNERSVAAFSEKWNIDSNSISLQWVNRHRCEGYWHRWLGRVCDWWIRPLLTFSMRRSQIKP